MEMLANRRGPGHIPENRIPEVLQSISRAVYDPQAFSHDNNCVICLEDYKATEMVTQLPCDPRHYFHTHCLEDWIKSGKNQCPMCRKIIQNFGDENAEDADDSENDVENQALIPPGDQNGN